MLTYTGPMSAQRAGIFQQACWKEQRVCPTGHDYRINHFGETRACNAHDSFLSGPTRMGVFEVLAVRAITVAQKGLPADDEAFESHPHS